MIHNVKFLELSKLNSWPTGQHELLHEVVVVSRLILGPGHLFSLGIPQNFNYKFNIGDDGMPSFVGPRGLKKPLYLIDFSCQE